jgi:hypothetical protein
MRYPSAIGTRPAAGCGDPDVARHDERGGDDDAQEDAHDHGLRGQARQTERGKEDLRLRKPVEQDRADTERDHDDVLEAPARLEQAAEERSSTDAALLVGQGVRRDPAKKAIPHSEDLGVRSPGVAAVLRHHRQRQRRIPDQHDEQDVGTRLEHEFDPDDDEEPDDGRPLPESLRVGPRRPTA